MVLMSFVASHHNRDLAVLEQLSVGSDQLGATVVGSEPSVHAAVVLPTCNRFEVYLDADNVARARAAVVAALGASTSLAPAAIDAALVTFEEDDAAQHLFSVAAGLESMVVGEAEISGQVRRAHADAHRNQLLTPLLDRLFQSALRTARVVASSTGLGTSGRSVLSVAFDLADSSVAWEGARALIIGTGSLAEQGVAMLRERGALIDGAFSPSGRGEAFAATHGVRVLTLAELAGALERADVVLACSGAEGIVLTPSLVGAARAAATSPLTIIDLALHRDVASGVAELRDVYVVDLPAVGAQAPGESLTAVEAARAIVAHAVARFGAGEDARGLDPAIVALREHVFGLLEREMARARPAAGADPAAIAQADATEAALRRFAKTLLHTPTVRAREHVEAGEPEAYLAAIRTLYGIDVAIAGDACPADGVGSDVAAASPDRADRTR